MYIIILYSFKRHLNIIFFSTLKMSCLEYMLMFVNMLQYYMVLNSLDIKTL
ncbi:hypothetical protein Hanom_Chr15g01354691 [Helianthus anomalus]